MTAAPVEVVPTMQAPMSVIGTKNCFILIAASSLLNLNSQWVGNLGKRFSA
jgi:hypothetical protein